MEVELNTNNLRNLCRICLGVGDYNVWEHKVCWNNEEDAEAYLQETEGITLHEVLKMYNNWQHSILDLDGELQLICKGCTSELQYNYRYYRRLLAANEQMKELYYEALQQEENKPLGRDQVIIEHIAFENNLPEFTDIASENSQPERAATPETCAEKLDIIALPIGQPPTKQAQKRKFVKNPKFILTGGVTQLLTNATGAKNFPPTLKVIDRLQESSNYCSPQKRTRKDFDEEVSTAQEEKISSELNRNVDSNVNKQIRTISGHMPEHILQAQPSNEVLTVERVPNDEYHDLAATHHGKELATLDGVEKDDEQAALPFATLSADDAGRSIYVCKYCPQAYTAPCFLITHARKSHVCKYCTKAFVKTTDLFAHVKREHQQHKCGFCGKELSTHGNLRAHIKRIHVLKTSEPAAELVANDRTNEEDSGDVESVYIEEISQPMTAEYLE